jgi:hypothetical protein
MTEELRLYTFTHFMLSSIQQGIQAGHAAVELTRRGHDLTIEWAKDWKTMICLNGGNSQELKELVFFLSNHDNTFPWCGFYESNEALDGSLTSIAIVLPARIFGTAENMRKMKAGEQIPHFGFTEWEYELIELLSKTGLAR